MSFKGLRLMIIAMFLVCLANISFAQTEWEKYEGNPVLTGGVQDAHVVKDGDTYKMWYNKGDGIYYATSLDGINWTEQGKVLQIGSLGGWDEEVGDPFVIKDTTYYKMWFMGRDAIGVKSIGYATSTDGVNWTKYDNNPILVPDTPWEGDEVDTPCVIKDEGIYKMWYGEDSGIGYATSLDGINWEKYSKNPLLTGGGECSVIKNSVYEMWYAGKYDAGIYYATSLDGINWIEHGQVLQPGPLGSWDDGLREPSVIKDGSTYKMWYDNGGDGDGAIGYATMVNNPPSAFELVYPADGQTGLGTTVEFRWKESTDPDGNSVTYDFYYCEDKDFPGCEPEVVASLKNSKDTYYAGIGYGGGFILFGVVLAGHLSVRRRIALLIGMIILTAMLLVSCGGGDGNGDDGAPSDEVSYTVSGLNTSTIYYWKVVAKDGNGGEIESEIRSFTTQ